MLRQKVYDTWNAMRQRYCNPNNLNWKNYGERGIKVCHRNKEYRMVVMSSLVEIM
jgi:hypothetical protein